MARLLFILLVIAAVSARKCHKMEVFQSPGGAPEYKGLPESCSEVDLYRSELEDEHAIALATTVATHPNLRWLGLSENRIGERGATALLEALKKNKRLTALKLWDQKKIPKGMGKPITEETLDDIIAQCKANKDAALYTPEEEAKIATARLEDVFEGKVKKHVFAEGSGDEYPAKGAKVKAHYTGTLINGDKFDSSRDRGQPFEFTLGQGQVIGCWDKGFATMKKGEKALLTCASEQAYGDNGSPPKIPGGATLKFDVELIEFDKGSAAKEL